MSPASFAFASSSSEPPSKTKLQTETGRYQCVTERTRYKTSASADQGRHLMRERGEASTNCTCQRSGGYTSSTLGLTVAGAFALLPIPATSQVMCQRVDVQSQPTQHLLQTGRTTAWPQVISPLRQNTKPGSISEPPTSNVRKQAAKKLPSVHPDAHHSNSHTAGAHCQL